MTYNNNNLSFYPMQLPETQPVELKYLPAKGQTILDE